PGLLRVGQALGQLLRVGAGVLVAQLVDALAAAADLADVDLPEPFLGRFGEHAEIVTQAGRCGRVQDHAGEQTCRRMSSSSSASPAPITTEESGSSARKTGSPVSSRRSASRFLSRAPP